MIDALGNPQSVLVLGGGSDIAAATVRQLVARRCRTVVLAGRRPEILDRVAADLRRGAREAAREARARGTASTAGGETDPTIECIAFDALDRSGHEASIAAAFDRPEGIDLVLVAFAILGDQSRDAADPESAARVIDVNLAGAVSAMIAVVNAMVAQGRGTIVVLSSVAGVRVRKSNYIYGASKAGLDGFALGLADSLAGGAVKVMVVRPGFVTTKMTAGLKKAPLATTPEAVATAIVRGLESGAGVVWVPPALRWVMAVLKHLPRALFRRIPG